MKKLVIFDLDGTLIDTLDDLTAAVNFSMGEAGYPTHTRATVCSYVGTGIRNLIIKALPFENPTPELVDERLASFVAYYTEHIDVYTRPYPGVHEALRSLRDMGLKVAVASNKFQAGAEKLVGEFFADIDFACVIGNREDLPLKPSPEVVRYCMEAAGVEDLSEVVLVGDSATDMKTARNAGIDSIGVSWGFRSVEELKANGAGAIVYSAGEIAAQLA